MLMCLLGNASVRFTRLGWQPWVHQKQRRRPVTCTNSVSEDRRHQSTRTVPGVCAVGLSRRGFVPWRSGHAVGYALSRKRPDAVALDDRPIGWAQ